MEDSACRMLVYYPDNDARTRIARQVSNDLGNGITRRKRERENESERERNR